MLADPAAAEDVAQGIAQGIGEGKGYVDISTIDGDTANRIKEVPGFSTDHDILHHESAGFVEYFSIMHC